MHLISAWLSSGVSDLPPKKAWPPAQMSCASQHFTQALNMGHSWIPTNLSEEGFIARVYGAKQLYSCFRKLGGKLVGRGKLSLQARFPKQLGEL